jgi:hypothetical protein
VRPGSYRARALPDDLLASEAIAVHHVLDGVKLIHGDYGATRGSPGPPFGSGDSQPPTSVALDRLVVVVNALQVDKHPAARLCRDD